RSPERPGQNRLVGAAHEIRQGRAPVAGFEGGGNALVAAGKLTEGPFSHGGRHLTAGSLGKPVPPEASAAKAPRGDEDGGRKPPPHDGIYSDREGAEIGIVPGDRDARARLVGWRPRQQIVERD